MIRAFFALPLPEALLSAVCALQAELRPLAPALRWTDPEKLHLTLKFLGSVPDTEVAALSGALNELAHRCAPFVAVASGLDAFPALRRARVLALRLSEAESESRALEKFAQDLDAVAERSGVRREARPFKAHVTLARARPPADVRALVENARWSARPCVFEHVRLYQSRGGVYDVLHDVRLGALPSFDSAS
jgi:RNA 2',3'-cyclic 3'-phosphodiesterase